MNASFDNAVSNADMAEHMVLGQLYTNDIVDKRILGAMHQVPRELFVPEALKGSAYVDDDLEVAKGRFLIEPLVSARLIDLAQVTAQERVLVVGCLHGYMAAVLAYLCAKVIAIDTDPAFIEQTRRNLSSLGITNAEAIAVHALEEGHASLAPYDVIIIPGAIEIIPDKLGKQLATKGRLATIRQVAGRPGGCGGLGKGLLVMGVNGQLQYREHFDASVPLVPGFERPAGFHFPL